MSGVRELAGTASGGQGLLARRHVEEMLAEVLAAGDVRTDSTRSISVAAG
jgi:hypothetical protein